MIESEKLIVPLTVNLQVRRHKGQPAIEIRRMCLDEEVIKALVTAAFKERPIIVQPIVKDKIKAIGSLCDVGLVYRENEDYHFTF